MQILDQAALLQRRLFTICVLIGTFSLIIWIADPIFIYGNQIQWIWNIVGLIPYEWAPDIPQAIIIAGIGSIPHIIITGSAFIVAALIGKHKSPVSLTEAKNSSFLSTVLLFAAAMVGLAEFSAFEQYYLPVWQDILFLASESSYDMLWLNIVVCFLPKLLPIILSIFAGIISLKVMELKSNAP